MKSIAKKIASMTMTLIVLFSTVSFTVEKHFCGDFLVDISYFGNETSDSGCCDEIIDNNDTTFSDYENHTDNMACCDELEEDNCNTLSDLEEEKEDCCTDEIKNIEGQNDLTTTSAKQITLKQFAVLFTISYNNLFLQEEKQLVLPEEYSPPNLIQNTRILHQVFII